MIDFKKIPLTKKRKIQLTIFVVFLFFFWWILPNPLFKNPVCTVLEDQKHHLLAAHIAEDGQWRFPERKTVPAKFAQAAIQYEDKRFRYHWGFDIVAFSRAIWLNIKHRKVMSGGSTLTMQTIRMSRKNPSRTILEKIYEIFLATRLEFSYSKDRILALYASNAPFGGNVVGIDAASWRYFGRKPDELSWAESALLAVLPNSPALIHLSKNRSKLLKKRNELLKRLYEKKIIKKDTYLLSIDEPLPEEPHPFPQIAPHLLTRAYNEIHASKKKNQSYTVQTTLDITLQQQVSELLNRYSERMAANYIHNAAALVLDVETGDVVAYVGNVTDNQDTTKGRKVDIITAERSTGSILKPFLYCGMLSSGEILPDALIPDIPLYIDGYSPQNFSKSYDGAVPAHRALARSLNVPAVRLLMKYGVVRFHHLLQKVGLTTVRNSPEHYGLSLILGGCEASLWELCGVYASMARTLNHYTVYNGKYNVNDWHAPNYFETQSLERKKEKPDLENSAVFSASAIAMTFKAMLDVERPEEESSWEMFASKERIAWKTGTSFGFRDAWAIGVTPKYVVGVWVGNADGEGRPDLIGVKAAAPLLFDIFSILSPAQKWFDMPYDDMIRTPICRESGYLASENCPNKDTSWIPATGNRFQVCPYHKIIHLDKTGKFRVHSDCESPNNMLHQSWFILPPAMEWYYKSKNPTYKALPPYRADCLKMLESTKSNAMELIYPRENTKIYIPLEMDGSRGSVVFEAAHRNSDAIIFWHIDDEFVGQTKNFHHLALRPSQGVHRLTLVDENGDKLSMKFEIIDKKK